MFSAIQAIYSGRQSWKALQVYFFVLFKIRMQKACSYTSKGDERYLLFMGIFQQKK